MNRVVYSQLEVTTVGETAYHLIKQYEEDKNGYGEWNTFCEWYDGDALNNEASDYLR